jgi:hypothetical protein
MPEIILTQDGRIHHAEVKGHPHIHAFGKCERDVLGDLVRLFPTLLGLKITHEAMLPVPAEACTGSEPERHVFMGITGAHEEMSRADLERNFQIP